MPTAPTDVQEPNRFSMMPEFLAGGGELGQCIREYDWAATPLGPAETWPYSLRTALGILLNSAFPMFLFWGDEALCFYNDAYRPLLGHSGKHPCVGARGSDVWAEVWDVIGPQMADVRRTGRPMVQEDRLIPIYRNGQLEDVYWSYSYSPVFDETGSVQGVFVTCTDTTSKMLDATGLSQSERRFRALVTATSDVVYRMSADWSQLRELDGKGFLSDTAVPSTSWIETYIHPRDRARAEAAVAEAIRTRKPLELEHRVLKADGSLGWTFTRAIPMLDETGAITEWFGASTDISARRQIEEDLRTLGADLARSKRLYETVTDTTPDLIYVFDLDYRFTYANKALLAMWGRTWDESIGQGLRALGYEEWHAAMHEREIDQIVATKQSIRGTVTFPHAELGRRYYDYILTPVIGADGTVEAVAGTTRDVTDFKQAEAALRESEERFRLMADAIPEVIWVADAQGNNEVVNKRWEDYCGVPFEAEAYNASATQYIHPDDVPKVTAAFAWALQTGQPLEVEQRNRSASGEYRWFLNRAVPYRDPQTGEIVKWFGIGTDIHDRKLLQAEMERLVELRTRELAHSNQELYRSNEDLQQFAHAASHDLKEPVRKIITFADMLRATDGAALSDRGRMSLDKVRSAAERMMNMVNGVLGYSKLAATDQVWDRVDLATTLANVGTDLEVLIQQKGAVIEAEGPLPTLVGAPVLLHQLFYNLINNALKFSRDDAAPRIVVRGHIADGSRAEITVSDNGIGFEPEYAERIFKAFARLHPKDRYEGTGLGLSLCKRIVERHGGTIAATGVPGEGTTFHLTLPAAGLEA